jgi:HK97 family phage major capsid protein
MEKRAGMNVGTDSAGGFLAPDGFAQRVESAMSNFDQIFDAVSTFTTQRGGEFFYPVVDDAESFAEIIGEG